MRKIRLFFVILMGVVLSAHTHAQNNKPLNWLWGVDAAYVNRVEYKGGTYRNTQHRPTDFFQLIGKQYGADYVRLRVWHSPQEPFCDQADMLALAKRAKQAGMKILLDIHYADHWADPASQTLPLAWQALPYKELTQAVYDYSKTLVAAMQAQGTTPDMVQVGNEILNGMLWPHGKIDWSAPNQPAQWQQLASLLNAAISGIHATGATPTIMLHIHDAGVHNQQGQLFFDQLRRLSVPFDAIALSWYPLWHGSFEKLKRNLQALHTRYRLPVYVVETSYPWTLQWHDYTHNVIGLPKQLLPAYPATPKGQADYLAELIKQIKAGGGAGLFYWGGEWLAPQQTDKQGSTWENQTLFDFTGTALPALDVLANSKK